MRVATSGSHSTGLSTLIAAFAAWRPQYVCEPEAFEVRPDELGLLPSSLELPAFRIGSLKS